MGVLLAIFLIVNLNANSGLDKNKISSDVIEKAEKGEQVRVYIKLKTETSEGKSISSHETKEEVLKILENKIKHDFGEELDVFISKEELLELQNNPIVEFIEPVPTRSIFLDDSVPLINSSSELWNVQVNGTNLTGEGETICIIDTGINYSHVDLGGCYGDNDPTSDCKILGGWDFYNSDPDPVDDHGHGTHCAGIAAANGAKKGVAPDAKIIMIKACDSTGTSCPDPDIEDGINWCVDNSSRFNISVISLSLGGLNFTDYCPEDDLASSINNAIANNISVVVASGNNGWTDRIAGPACVENATAVGATTKTDGFYEDGNRWPLRLLVAPGVSITSTWKTGGYESSDGTSMATPHVAGAFAIINQYRRLEGSVDLTPREIEEVLNNSGKRLNDTSGSGLNFSRIKIYSTILEIDQGNPYVTLSSPADDNFSSNSNNTFTCISTDIQLSNTTFYLWNSTGGEVNQTTYNSTSATSFEFEINQTLENGTYTWNCLTYDNNTNYAWASSNRTIKVGNSTVILNSPSDNSYTTTNETTFNCTIIDTLSNLTNVTLKVWNATGKNLVYNETTTISGTSNETTFIYNLTEEDDYDWNCLVYDEESNLIYGESNYTITFDNTKPTITLVSPIDGASQSSSTALFRFNVTDMSAIANCSLILDNVLNTTDTGIIKNTTETITRSLGDGIHDWKIRCYDAAGNMNESYDERELTIDTDDGSGTSLSSSNSDSTSDETTDTTTTPITYNSYSITETEFEEGCSKCVSINDEINFTKGNESHRLKIEEIKNESIKVKIYSDPITLTITKGATEKADLDNDNIYDIAVTYNSYENSEANVTLKSIHEKIGTRQIFDPKLSNDIKEFFSSLIGFAKKLDKKTWTIIGIVGGVMLLGIIGYLSRRKIICAIECFTESKKCKGKKCKR